MNFGLEIVKKRVVGGVGKEKKGSIFATAKRECRDVEGEARVH